MPRKFVLTGGPNSGKSSMLEEFRKEGFKVVEESAREVIKEMIKEGIKVSDLDKDMKLMADFSARISEKQFMREEKIKGKKDFFLDRGAADVVAYYRLFKIKVPESLLAKLPAHKYDAVFWLDTLPEDSFENDSERREDYGTAKKIGKLILETYKSLKFPVYEVKVFSKNKDDNIKRRKEFILSKIKN